MEWRSARELRSVSDPAWPLIVDALSDSTVSTEMVNGGQSSRTAALEELQVTTRSFLGALASECGAIRVDHGWLRILGAGADGLPSMPHLTELIAPGARFLIVAVDVLGGHFAINDGSLPGRAGEVCYWGSHSLEWCSLGVGHADFVIDMIGGGVEVFYASERWPGWQDEVSAVPLAMGLSVSPPPFTREGRNIAMASRRPTDLIELIRMYRDLADQVRDLPQGATFRLNVKP